MPTIAYRQKRFRSPECNWLRNHAHNVASQAGQDGIIAEIFKIISPKSKIAVEFGGYDGKTMSNIWRLVVEEGWSGVFIEADPVRAAEIKINHPYDRVTAINQPVSWTGDNTLDATLERVGVSDVDFLSMDIDGNEWHCWAAMETIRPRVIEVEFNMTAPNELYFVQDADDSINQGSSLLAFIELARFKGYSLICTVGMDAFFVLDKYFHLFNIPDNGIDYMFDPAETVLYQGYDSTFYAAGHTRLFWKGGLPFGQADLQILPSHERFWGDRKGGAGELEGGDISLQDVIETYRVLLGRDPGPTDTIESWRRQPSRTEMVRKIASSPEACSRLDLQIGPRLDGLAISDDEVTRVAREICRTLGGDPDATGPDGGALWSSFAQSALSAVQAHRASGG